MKGAANVFLYRFQQFMNLHRGNGDMLRWITRFQLSVQRTQEAWNDTYLPITDPNNAEVRAFIAGLPAEEQGDITFLYQLPKPQIEEVEEPEPMDTTEAPKENAETPMDTSGVNAETGDLPQGEMPGSAKTEAPDVPMGTEVPGSSSQEEAPGTKVEPAEASPDGEEPATVDEHMGGTEEVKEEDMDASPEDEETMPPDISPETDDRSS